MIPVAGLMMVYNRATRFPGLATFPANRRFLEWSRDSAMKISLVVLDMAGTTVSDDDAVNTCLRQALKAGRFDVSRDEVNAVMGMPKPVAIRTLVEGKRTDGTPAPQPLIDTLYDDFGARMLRHYRMDPGVRPMPHAVDVLLEIRAAGTKIALDTGFSRPIADAILDRLGWGEGRFLDATVTSDEVARGRPFPDLIERAMKLTGVAEPKMVAKVGDTPSDLQEGASAGCGLVIGVTNGTHRQDQLAAYPHTHLISSLQELPALVLAGR
jgi:phosphonatase-like hydrolase